jgi:hypothetical protein
MNSVILLKTKVSAKKIPLGYYKEEFIIPPLGCEAMIHPDNKIIILKMLMASLQISSKPLNSNKCLYYK